MKSGNPVFFFARPLIFNLSKLTNREFRVPGFKLYFPLLILSIPSFFILPAGSALGQTPGSGSNPDSPSVIVQTDEDPAPKVIIPAAPKTASTRLITLDFNNVELPVFVKFVSEIVGRNFIIDERVRGKVTIFSPAKISVDKVYQVFLSVLALKGLAAVETGGMVQILPVAEVPPERDIHVYYLLNANAEETAKLLTSLVTRMAAAPQAGRPTPAARAAAARPSGQFEGVVQVIPDKATNALLITATPDDYELIRKVIEKLDIQRRQVYVEAVIMEVAEERLRDIGTDLGAVAGYQTNDDSLTVIGGFNQAPEDLLALEGIPGIDAGISTVNAKLLMRALQSTSDVNILSTPQILTTNNQKAKIVVGQEVPFITSTSQTTGALTQRNISREDVGVTLEITPEILEGDRVRMEIRQEISTLVDTPPDVLIELGPTKNKREATTSVIIGNKQTVVIGGLIRDDVTSSIKKIPLLGDIPILGWLFKLKTKRVVKTNLLIFLTPVIVQDTIELDEIREAKSPILQQAATGKGEEVPSVKEEFFNRINPPDSTR